MYYIYFVIFVLRVRFWHAIQQNQLTHTHTYFILARCGVVDLLHNVRCNKPY